MATPTINDLKAGIRRKGILPGCTRRYCYILLVSLGFFISCIGMVACKKGDLGPKGETGSDGPKGDEGDKGDKGDKGDSGTANVIYSAWVNIKFQNNYYPAKWGKAWQPIPAITQNVLDHGIVLVYMQYGNSNQIVQLPYPFDGGYMYDVVGVGSITLYSSYDASSNFFRYVIIPGGTPAINSINLEKYSEVRKVFHIED